VRKTIRNLLGAGWLLGALALLPAADWPGFRGPKGWGVSGEKALPVKWGPKEGLRWVVDLPGRGLSNPVIARGRVYVTACSGYRERRLHVLCYDARTGKKLWERQLSATGSTMCHPKTCMAAPTPVTDGNAVYALFATGDVVALDRGGNLLWYRSLAGDYPKLSNQVGMAASPALAGNTLLLPMENIGDSFAAGIDVKTGKNRWKVKRTRDINWCSPIVIDVGGKPAAVFQTSKEATAYDVQTGAVRWTHKADDLGNLLSPAAGGGLVFLPGQGRSDTLAVRPRQDGKVEVRWTTSQLRTGYPSPVYYKGRLYGCGGVAVKCLDGRDGELLWQQRAPGPFAGSPVIGDGKLYLVNEGGVTTVLSLADKGKVLARNKLYEAASVSERDHILATPAIAGGAIYLRSDRKLFCIGAKK
jgi:outer membrane protein assembly factor BamB